MIEEILNARTHYEVLRVDPSSDVATIRKAYIKISVKVHPDRNPSPDATRAFQKVSEAYRVLSDEGSRREYDQRTSWRKESVEFSFEDALRVFRAAVRAAQADGDTAAYLRMAAGLLGQSEDVVDAALFAAAGASAAYAMLPDNWKDNIRKHATPENAILAVGTAAVIAGLLCRNKEG